MTAKSHPMSRIAQIKIYTLPKKIKKQNIINISTVVMIFILE